MTYLSGGYPIFYDPVHANQILHLPDEAIIDLARNMSEAQWRYRQLTRRKRVQLDLESFPNSPVKQRPLCAVSSGPPQKAFMRLK